MTDINNDGVDEDVAFRRRDVLKAAGIAGAITTFGAGTATAKKPKRFIVGTTPGRAGVARRQATRVRETLRFGGIGEAVVGEWPEEALRGLKRNPHVRYVEEDIEGEYHAETLPWGVDRIDAEVAHDSGKTGSGIHVTVIDSGIDSDHPDLAANLGTGYAPEDACTTCPEDWDDELGHGTQVAGIVAAIDNDDDVIGVAPAATLHAVKVGNTAPSASGVASGLTTAGDEKHDVATMSLSIGESDAVKDAIAHAVDNDVVVIASAGNNGNNAVCNDNDCVSFPANDSRVIAVSNVAIDDTLWPSSSVGPEVDLGAPGQGVLSTALGGGTANFGGTSAAAPHVAGAAAQLLADGTAPADVRSVLKNNAEDIGLASFEQGAGLLDLATALGQDSANDLLEVETDTETGVGFTEATLNGDLIRVSTGLEDATVGFEWGESGGGLPNTVDDGTRFTPGTFDVTLTGLEENTNYEFRAFATVVDDVNDVSTEYGALRSFSTVDNLDPNANISHSPLEPNPGQTVTFDGSGSGSGDLSGDSIVLYEWDLDDDGAFDDATGVTASRFYSTGGTKTVGLRVTDEFDQTDTATHTFYVNMAPTASFTAVTDPVVRDEAATFDASNSEDTDGTVDLYEWDWDYDGTFAADESTTSPMIDHTFTTGGEHMVALRVTDDDGATSEVVTMTVVVHIRVTIDILPSESDPNSINPNRRGNVPVAVLHTSAFDPPAELDPTTVRFGDPDDVGFDASYMPQGGATPVHAGGHIEDVDDDGDLDSLFHFPVPDADFDPADTEGELVGLTTDGVPVFGAASVNIVGGGGP